MSSKYFFLNFAFVIEAMIDDFPALYWPIKEIVSLSFFRFSFKNKLNSSSNNFILLLSIHLDNIQITDLHKLCTLLKFFS